MITYYILVKGGVVAAKAACNLRGVKPLRLDKVFWFNQVQLWVEAKPKVLADWYAEDAAFTEGYGYEDGALILYMEAA